MRLHEDGARRAEAYTLSPVPSPVIPSGVIHSFCRDSIVFVVLVVVALEISTIRTSYHQLYPPQSKNWLRQLLRMPHFEITDEADLL